MSQVVWRPVKRIYCDRIGEQVQLEAKIVFPADLLPDPPARVLAHRCSQGMDCNRFDKPTCVWAGTRPDHDPFA